MTRLLPFILLVSCAIPAFALPSSYYPTKPNDPQAVYLVKGDFPVFADGVGDDAPALQQAIDKVDAQSRNGIVFIPEGTYRLSQTVRVYRGIRLIGYGQHRPVLLLAENTPGYQSGEGKYLLFFAHNRTKPDEPPMDGTEGTLFSGLNNIDVEIRDGNPAAVAVRAHVAQQTSLEHVDFRIGSARGAVEELGNEVEDCRFFGGEFAIKTAITSAGWQTVVFDSEFEGQRAVAIDTHEAGMTVIRCRFRNVPIGIRIPLLRVSHLTGESTDRVFVKDSRFEDVKEAALWIARYYDPKTQVNVENVECARVPIFLSFSPFLGGLSRIAADKLTVPADGEFYAIRQLSHGLHITVANSPEPERRRDTVVERARLLGLSPIPPKDFPELPPRESWVNIRELGAKGDGITDDTAVFQQAIAQHRAIYIPMGNYRLSDTLTLAKDTMLVGLHSSQTRLILLPSTPGFTDAAAPKPLILAPKGSTPILSGLGVAPQNTNAGVIAVKWMAGTGSYIDDVQISSGRTKTGHEQLYGLWVTDGGAGTFKNIWSPNESATNGLYISDTSVPGIMYQISVEHHLKVEIVLKNVQNWTFHTIQTEEVSGDEKTASLEMEGCQNLKFVTYYMYHNSGTNLPFPYGIRVVNSSNILFRGLHNFSGGPFPFDRTLIDVDSGAAIAHPEVAWLKIR